MSELASYSIQAVFFALVAVVVVSRSKKTDLYQFALISIWLIGVIAIYAKYKDGQIFFYSNDQDFHRQEVPSGRKFKGDDNATYVKEEGQ